MKYKLLALDLDGTLLNSNKDISALNKKAIEQAKQSGVEIVIATGRTYTAAKQYHNELNLSTPLISCNGGYVYDAKNKKVLFGHPIERNYVLEVFKVFEEMDIYYQFYGANTIYTKGLMYLTKQWYERNDKLKEEDRVSIKILADPVKFMKEEGDTVYKMLAIEEDEEKFEAAWAKIAQNKELELVSSFKGAIDVMKKGITKGNALKAISSHLNIDMKETIAMGDNNNDSRMLEVAGLGIATENATKEAKLFANEIGANHNEDAVAKAIYKHVL